MGPGYWKEKIKGRELWFLLRIMVVWSSWGCRDTLKSHISSMSCCTWNIREVSAPSKAKIIGQWIHVHKLWLVGLLETRVKSANIGKIASVIDASWTWVHNGHLHNKVRILPGWASAYLEVLVIQSHLQFLHCKVTVKHSGD